MVGGAGAKGGAYAGGGGGGFYRLGGGAGGSAYGGGGGSFVSANAIGVIETAASQSGNGFISIAAALVSICTAACGEIFEPLT